MAYNPNFQNGGGGNRGGNYNQGYGGQGGGRQGGGGGYNNGGGGGGGYGGGGGGQGPRKRGRDDDNADGNYRRRNNERGDYSSPRRDNRGGPMGGNGGGGGGMGMGGGGGYPQIAQSTLHQNFRDSIWKLGAEDAYNPTNELPTIANIVQTQFHRESGLVFETFRVAITEVPHKIPHYAALITYLSLISSVPAQTLAARIDINPLPVIPGLPPKPKATDEAAAATTTEDAPVATGDDVEMKAEEVKDDAPAAPQGVNIGRAIVEDLVKFLQQQLDERKWRASRYLILLFSSLSSLPSLASPLVSVESLVALLTTFTDVLSEPGLRASRGDECVRVVVEAILRLDSSLSGETDGLRDTVKGYLASRRVEREVFGGETAAELEDKLEALVSSISPDSALVVDIVPSVFASLPAPSANLDMDLSAITLPSIKLPSADLDSVKVTKAPPTSAGLRGDEGVGYEGVRLYLKLFDDESVPAADDPSGTLLRSLIFDIIDLYEINRKECATILLSLPNWCKKGTFRVKDADPDDIDDSRDWSLENLLVESILTSLFALPRPRLPSSYYHSLLTELCRLSPQTIAPSLGKCVRRLYANLGVDDEGPTLDPEGVRRLAEWFSVHLSNFSFMWGWADWVPDMELGAKHPKRVFVERTIELEVRLSYFDRVQGTIPAPMLDTGVMDEDAPGPEYAYEAADHTHAAAAASLLRMMRSKGTIPEVESELASFQTTLQTQQGLTEEEAAVIKRDMTIQTVLSVGSRSFSHFLNVLERYLPLLRTLSPSPSTRLELLKSVAHFWRRNAQFRLIVLEKLLQYRLVDSADVIAYVFEDREGKTWSDIDLWSTLKSTVATVEGRVASVTRKIEQIEREKMERAAQELDAGGDAIIDDSEEELAIATAQLVTAESELTVTVVEVIRRFDGIIAAAAGKATWESWWIEGWFREFCRSMADSKLLARPTVVQGIERLELKLDSTVVAILDSAKTWNDFV